MGLTIHYNLRTSLTEPEDVQALLAALRQAATRLPFQRVGPLKEFRDRVADFEQSAPDDDDRWLKVQASESLEAGRRCYRLKPVHIIAFTVEPGPGCEPANLGLCTFPASIAVPGPDGRLRQLATGRTGWGWGSFCKTQYASDPRVGGVVNFLRCHVGLVTLLDIANRTELMTVGVTDESGYWELRDVKQLVNTVGEWNELVAAAAGSLQDEARRLGVTAEAAIAGFPDFEHLEARGLDRLRRQARGQG